ncbi:MAG: GNAT family N-acetyltransferase [Kofleriaceae bacterium]
MATTIPVIETARLVLRGHREADLDDAAVMWADPEVTRFIGGKPSTREEVWSRLLRYVGHWSLNGYGFWAVCEKATGRFAGEVGMADFKRDMEPALDAPEVGWVFAPHAHGKGYATEAVQAALAWGVRLGGRFSCLIGTDNRASIRVAEKCGFQETGRTTYHAEPTIVLAI